MESYYLAVFNQDANLIFTNYSGRLHPVKYLFPESISATNTHNFLVPMAKNLTLDDFGILRAG
jgi:hypothetical protein